MGGMNVTRILAPAAAGLLIAPLGVGWVYTLTFAMFCLAVASEFRLPIHGMVAAKQRAPFWDDLAGGFRYVRQHRLIALLLGVGLMFPFFG